MRGYLVDRCPFCSKWIERATAAQHAAITMICKEIAKQRDWPRGSGKFMEWEEWADLLMCAYERTQGRGSKLVPRIDGPGFDPLHRRRKSKLPKVEASEVIEFMRATAAVELGLQLTDPEAA